MLFEALTPPQLRFTVNTKFNGKVWDQMFGTELPQVVSFSINANDAITIFPPSQPNGGTQIEIDLSSFQIAEGVTCSTSGWKMKQEGQLICLSLAGTSEIQTERIELELSNLRIQNQAYLEGKGLGGVQKELPLSISFQSMKFQKRGLVPKAKRNAISTVKVGLPPRSFG